MASECLAASACGTRMCSSARSPVPMQVAAAMFTPASLIAAATSASAPGLFSMSMTRSTATLRAAYRRARSAAERAAGQRDGAVEDGGLGRRADRDAMVAAGDHPAAAVEAGEHARLGRDRDAARLARREVDALEAEQAPARAVRRAREVELRHVGAGAGAGVGHREARGDRVAAVQREVGVRERGVAEPV